MNRLVSSLSRLAFQSTPPVREVTNSPTDMRAFLEFQPPPPVREVTEYAHAIIGDWLFQSTPPVREVTTFPPLIFVLILISIHTSRAGGDERQTKSLVGINHFNPHLPCGR